MPRPKMTAQEKADDRAVRDYLDALSTNTRKRGRQRTAESVEARISAIGDTLGDASPTRRLNLVQERLDLEAELDAINRARNVDIGGLEARFIDAAASYGAKRGISYTAWREIGVSADTLKSAGIQRTRRS